MSPTIAPINVQIEAAPELEMILPRASFAPPVNRADSINAQVAANHSLATLANRYLPEAVGALKGDHKTIIAKLDELIAGVHAINARLDRLESGE